ncbi:MAG: inorganic phosphate transporter [Myxococcales bacterium]|nr:inorganic phosphate transporter [Myxococcales bacterium]
MDLATIVIATATIAGLYMAWNIGANDVANAMGTSVGSGALTLRAAIIVAAVFEFGGALLVGGTVTDTIRKGIVHLDALGGDPMTLAVGMTCCLLAAAIWLHVATYFGWPVSTTHSIVGAVVGFGLIGGGVDAVDWGVLGKVVASWVISPVTGGLIAFLLFTLIKRRIFNVERPLMALRGWGPLMLFPIGAVLSLAMMFKGLKPLKLDLPLETAIPIAIGFGLLCSIASTPWIRRATRRVDGADTEEQHRRVEKVFLVLQVITACFVAFAHGSNDVANAVGPLSAVYGALTEGIGDKVEVPLMMLLVGAVGIVIGLATYGYKVMATIGKEITELTPSRGFTAEFAAAMTIVAASKLGLPVSTTHTLVGSVIGVGFARSIGAINLQVVKGIVASWFITVPFTAILAGLLYLLARLAI